MRIDWEKVRWFLGELKRVKSGLFGFILLIILIGLALAFPLLANPQDIENWSGHGEYWDEKMLPKLASPEWVNWFVGNTLPETTNLTVSTANYTLLDLNKDEDMLKYLEAIQPGAAEAIRQLPQDQQKQLLDSIRKGLGFRYILYIENDLEYTLTANTAPDDIIMLSDLGPIIIKEGMPQGISIEWHRPDGIVLTFTPGSNPNMSNVWDINQYADLTDHNLLNLLKIPSYSNTTEEGTYVKYIATPDHWRFSIREYMGGLLNTGNPDIINKVMGPLLEAAGESYSPGTYINPTNFIMSQAVKGITTGEAPLLKGTYVLKTKMLIRVPEEFPVGEFKILRAKVLGIYGVLGTDNQGRDLWSAMLYGLRWALIIGVVVSVLSTLIGVIYGVISGYMGGWTDIIMLRFAQIMYSLPVLPLLIILAYFFGQSIWNIVWLLVVFSWVGMVFTVRSMVLQIKENLYVEAARAIGASSKRIILRHVFPQVLPYTFASIALSVPGAILSEAGLSFLGLGDPAVVTWGKILHDAQAAGAVLNGAWWWVVPPGIGIAVVGMTFVFIGYALDRILNPRLIR